MSTIHVIKRDGSREPIDIEKFHKVIEFACEGLSGVSVSDIAMRTRLQFFDGIKTTVAMEATIKSAADLISEDQPNYQYVAGRLVNYHLRKEVFGQFSVPSLYSVITKNVEAGFYDAKLLTSYTAAEWAKIETFVDHERDMQLTFVGMEQLRGKYLVKNRVTGKIFETPQIAYVLIAATLFSSYPADTRLKWVKDYYDAISKHDVSLPTPVMAGVRTPQRQYSSCTLIECGDSLNSISATSTAIVRYVSQKAGIGLGAGGIRAFGEKVRNGDTTHTGVIPFFKLFQAAVKSCSQGAIRNGCVERNSFIEIVDTVEIDGVDYRLDDTVTIDGVSKVVKDVLNER